MKERPEDLKGRMEWAIAKELYKAPALKDVVPQIWRSVVPKKAVTLSITCTPRGEEAVPGYGIYWTDNQVRVQGRITKVDPSFYIQEVEKVFAEWAAINLLGDVAGKAAFAKIFQPHGIFVHGAYPYQVPDSFENNSRIANVGISLLAFKL